MKDANLTPDLAETADAQPEASKAIMCSDRPIKIRWPLAMVVVAGTACCWFTTIEPSASASLWRTYRVPGMLLNLTVSYLAMCALYYLLGSGRARLRLFRLVVVSMVFVGMLVLIESPTILLGYNYGTTFGTSGQNIWLEKSNNVNKSDPELLHIHWPHSGFHGDSIGNLVRHGIGQHETYHVDLEYDQHGFRNDTDLDQADIVVIGDSFIEAALLSSEDTVVKLLERRLGQAVVNLGQAAYGLKQELIVLKRFGLPLKPKTVFWFFFDGNDLRDVAGYEWAYSHYDEFLVPIPLRSRLFVRNALLLLSRLTTPTRTESTEAALDKSGLITLADGSTQRVYFGQTNGLWTPLAWSVLTETLNEANELCRGAGAELIVVYISRKFRIYKPFLTFEPGSLASKWEVNALPETMAAWCKQQGIDFVDTIPAMQIAVSHGQHPYFVDDVHWNALGNSIAAQVVVDYMKTQKKLYPGL